MKVAMRPEQVLIPLVRQIKQRPRLAEALLGRDRWGNSLGPERAINPFPTYEIMRSEGPVTYHKMYQAWFITGYDEAKELLASPHGRVSFQRDMLLDVRPFSQMGDRARSLMYNFLLLQDPPTHTRLRKLVSRAFTPRQVQPFGDAAAKLATELLDAIDDDAEPDMYESFTKPLPVWAICTLMGIPRERWEWMAEKSNGVTKMLDVFNGFDPAEMDRHVDDLYDYFPKLAAEKLKADGHDLITELARAEDEGDRLSEDEFVSMVAFILFAGHETTTGLLGNAIVALANFPEQRAKVRSNPALWPNAVEELLRYDTSVSADPRAPAHDMELGGKLVKAGESCTILLAACNRDPRRYDRPSELILDRENPRPISFGHGLHHCLGANLARLETRIGLQAFVERFGDYTIDAKRIGWNDNIVTRGPTYLPVRRG